MKILFITHHTRTRARCRAVNLAERLAGRGHEITVLCTRDRGAFGIRDSMEKGVLYLETPALLTGKLRCGIDPLDILSRRRLLRRLSGFELIHAFETRPATIHALLPVIRRNRIPLVIDWIDWWGRGGLITVNRPKWYGSLFGNIETFYEENYRTRADATTVICDGLARRACALGVPQESIFKIRIGADTANIPLTGPAENRQAFGLEPDGQIAMFSAMAGMMDVQLVFAAARKVAETHPDFRLVMTGNRRQEMECRAQEAGLQGRSIHLGKLPREQFIKALTCADVFLLPLADTPYNHGRWPAKTGDYLAAGRPVISNPTGEIRSLMEKYPLGVLTAFEANRFADAICTVLDNPHEAQAMGRTARTVAETELNWESIIDELETAYRHAIDRKKSNLQDSHESAL